MWVIDVWAAGGASVVILVILWLISLCVEEGEPTELWLPCNICGKRIAVLTSNRRMTARQGKTCVACKIAATVQP